jgi:hypothetical protein
MRVAQPVQPHARQVLFSFLVGLATSPLKIEEAATIFVTEYREWTQ